MFDFDKFIVPAKRGVEEKVKSIVTDIEEKGKALQSEIQACARIFCFHLNIRFVV